MNPKFSSYLFTELVIELKKNSLFDKNEIYHELIDRLIFCKMDYDTAVAFIELEELIIKMRKIKWDSMLYNKYWWLNENLEFINPNKTLFNYEYNKYFLFLNEKYYKHNIIPNTILSVSELICLMDEATYIDININNKGICKDEIDFFKSTSYDKNNKNVEKDIYFRIMASYEVAHGNSNFPSNIEDVSKIFYRNEVNILFLCKWTFKRKYQYTQKKIWKSYSSEYYSICKEEL